jgi:hypothetical protein
VDRISETEATLAVTGNLSTLPAPVASYC